MGFEHIPKEIKKFINNENIIANIFRLQAYDRVTCGYFRIGFIKFMLNGNNLTDFTNLFSPNDFKKSDRTILNYFLTNLLNNQQFRLNKINEIGKYFIADIKERKLMSKRLSKYIASFDYFDKSLILLSATSGSTSIASFATVIGTPIGIVSANLSLEISLSTGLVKKLLEITRTKKKKHNKIVMLARSKLNCIESKISEALMNNQISHKDFNDNYQ